MTKPNLTFWSTCPDNLSFRRITGRAVVVSHIPGTYSIILSSAQKKTTLCNRPSDFQTRKMIKFPFCCLLQTNAWQERWHVEIHSSLALFKQRTPTVCFEILLAFVHTRVMTEIYPGILLGIKQRKLPHHQYLLWPPSTHDTDTELSAHFWQQIFKWLTRCPYWCKNPF